MQLPILLTFFFSSAFVSALPAFKRDAGAVLAAIAKIRSDVSDLTTDVSTFTGADIQNCTLIPDFENLKLDIESTTTAVTSSGSFNSIDSGTISNTLQNLTPHVITLLVDLMAKEPVVASAGFAPVVHSSLETLNDDTNDLFTTLENAVDLSTFGGISSSQEQIGAAFTDAIATYA